MILRKSRELLAGLFAARLVDAHVGRSAPAAHQLAPFADRHAEDAVAAVLLAGDHEPQVDTVPAYSFKGILAHFMFPLF